MKVVITVIQTVYLRWGSRNEDQDPYDIHRSVFYKGEDEYPTVGSAVKRVLEVMPDLSPRNFFTDVKRWHKTFSFSHPKAGIGYYYLITDDDRCVEMTVHAIESVPQK